MVHGPSCTTWPPPWLTFSSSRTPATLAALPATPVPESPPDVSPWYLPPELYEHWAERLIETELGLPAGTLRFFDPPKRCTCDFCKATGKELAPEPGEDLFSVVMRINRRRRGAG